MATKVCADCHKELPLSDFQIDNQKLDGLRSWCRSCRNKKQRGYVEVWREKRRSQKPPKSKRCSRCEKRKAIRSFCRDSCRPDGFHVWCGKCRSLVEKGRRKRRTSVDLARESSKNRASWLVKKYKLTPGEFNAMAEAQGNKCSICKSAPRRLEIDHNHKTGAIRGLLCGSCNRAIGLLADEPERCVSAGLYLNRHKIGLL